MVERASRHWKKTVTEWKDLKIQVTKKKMKNMYLRVDSDGTIRVSAPFCMSDREIQNFLEIKEAWIRERLAGTNAVCMPWDAYSGMEREQEKKKCRQRLEEILPEMIRKCEKITGVHATKWRFRDMKTRWGTCNVAKKRIWLNVWLGKYPAECVEYVVFHELTHLLECGHNTRFYRYMDEFCPDWKERKNRLNHMEWNSQQNS